MAMTGLGRHNLPAHSARHVPKASSSVRTWARCCVAGWRHSRVAGRPQRLAGHGQGQGRL